MKDSSYPPPSVKESMLHGVEPSVFNYYVSKFGYNASITTATDPEDVWALGGSITWPSAEAASTIESDSTSDDVGGTGAITVFVEGVADTTFAKRSETITLDGTTPVNLANEYLFVNRAYVVTAGTNETNVGNITIKVSATTVAYIPAGDGQTLQAAIVLPKFQAYTPYLLGIWCGISRNASAAFAQMNLCRQKDGEAKRVIKRMVVQNNGTGIFQRAYLTPETLATGDRIWWEVSEVSATVEAFAGFDIAWF